MDPHDELTFTTISVDIESLKNFEFTDEFAKQVAKVTQELLEGLLFIGGGSTVNHAISYKPTEPIRITYKPLTPGPIIPEVRNALEAITPTSLEDALAKFVNHQHDWKATDCTKFRLACTVCGKEMSLLEFHGLNLGVS